jgi:hypothetical protein
VTEADRPVTRQENLEKACSQAATPPVTLVVTIKNLRSELGCRSRRIFGAERDTLADQYGRLTADGKPTTPSQ